MYRALSKTLHIFKVLRFTLLPHNTDVMFTIRDNCHGDTILGTTRFYNQTQNIAQRGARTHDPEIKSLMLYRLS